MVFFRFPPPCFSDGSSSFLRKRTPWIQHRYALTSMSVPSPAKTQEGASGLMAAFPQGDLLCSGRKAQGRPLPGWRRGVGGEQHEYGPTHPCLPGARSSGSMFLTVNFWTKKIHLTPGSRKYSSKLKKKKKSNRSFLNGVTSLEDIVPKIRSSNLEKSS